MRLHRLELRAFGPFAGPEEIDFEELNEAGLFLLSGPTGAGKTSILDAVCFALYGYVPGARGTKSLKSQHAAPGEPPEVVLDFSIRERRFVVRRTPEWQRPKRRGTGSRTINATATLVETTDGEQRLLSSRAQEVGHEISDLVGMTATQFVQVAMLPQGEFQRFLRASSQERHDVLEHLFRTERFSRIEDWVQEHSHGLRAKSLHHQSGVQRLLDVVADRAGAPLPDELGGDRLATADPALPLAWARDELVAAGVRHVEARNDDDLAVAVLDRCREAHRETTMLAALVARREEARGRLHRLAAESDRSRAAAEKIAADRRAAACVPVLRLLDEAGADLGRKRARLERALSEIGDGDLDTDALASAEQATRDRASRLEAVLPRDLARIEAVRAGAEAARERDALTAELEALEQQSATLPRSIDAARLAVDELRSAATRREAITLELATAHERHRAAAAVPPQRAQVGRLERAERAARDAAADAREAMQEVVARRLAGIAAELAGRLRNGMPCQVCGSADHPAPARTGPGAVTELEQDEATTRYDRLHAAHADATRRHGDARNKLATLSHTAADADEAAAFAEVARLEAELARAAAAARASSEAATELGRLTDRGKQLDRAIADARADLATAAASLRHHQDSAAAAEAEVTLVVPPRDGPLAAVLQQLRARMLLLATGAAASREVDAASARFAEACESARATCSHHGFTGPDEAVAATLSSSERERLEALVEEHTAATAGAKAILDDPQVVEPADRRPPDAAASALALASAEAAAAQTTRTRHAREQALEALRTNVAALGRTVPQWELLRRQADEADDMSQLLRGMGRRNSLQMRLSAYVLATRLDQVAEAANERLALMRDQRYLLQRTSRAARRNAQAGLGLEVLDQWTGESRDPSTLSGGETFVVSLALALGLADVVGHESGGTDIRTLFVDEGFGSLDADTLDDVMDRLDGLRAGGRTVGVVSHVLELRGRIPTQVQVDKGRSGSTISVSVASCP